MIIFLLLFCFNACFSDEHIEDPYYFNHPDPIWFEDHLWEPYALHHSENCPCMCEHYDSVLIKEK